MSANTASRQPSRERVATLLEAVLVPGTLKAVYPYLVADPSGLVPFICVSSDATLRSQYTKGTVKNRAHFRLLVLHFLLAPDIASGWTEQNVEDHLDDVDRQVANVISDNRGKANDPTLPWNYLSLTEDYSQIFPLSIGGVKYWVEKRSVIVEVIDP